jgi:hypothetical protein
LANLQEACWAIQPLKCSDDVVVDNLGFSHGVVCVGVVSYRQMRRYPSDLGLTTLFLTFFHTC